MTSGITEEPHREAKKISGEEAPPILKSWKNLYFLVLGNLLLWIILFSLFTWTFK